MFTDDLSDSYGPSRADLDALEHIEHHRVSARPQPRAANEASPAARPDRQQKAA